MTEPATAERYSDITNELSFWVEKIWHLPSAIHADGDFPEGLIEVISSQYDTKSGIRRIFPDLKLNDEADDDDHWGGEKEVIKEHLSRCLFFAGTHTGFLIQGNAAKITRHTSSQSGLTFSSVNYGWMTHLLGYGATYDEAFADLTEQVKAYREEEKARGDQW